MRRLRNATQIPDATVREIESFVLPPGGVGSYDLRLGMTSAGALKGRAYTKGSGYHDTARPFVNCYLGADHLFPKPPEPAYRPGYLPTPWMATQVEALVYLMAHELRHLWQSRVPRGRRVWGSRGQFSERDADAFAIRKLRGWRRRTTYARVNGSRPAAINPCSPKSDSVGPPAFSLNSA